MKLLIIVFLSVQPIMSGGVYDFSISTLDGTSLPLSQFQGKKLLIVVLPASHEKKDSLQLLGLDSLSRKYSGQMSVVAIPSYENGFTDGTRGALLDFYRSQMGSQVFLAQGMYTSKASGSGQHPLFSWLTSKTGNGHFDNDVKGPGQKFWVNGSGQLMGVFGPEVTLTDRMIGRLIAAQ